MSEKRADVESRVSQFLSLSLSLSFSRSLSTVRAMHPGQSIALTEPQLHSATYCAGWLLSDEESALVGTASEFILRSEFREGRGEINVRAWYNLAESFAKEVKVSRWIHARNSHARYVGTGWTAWCIREGSRGDKRGTREDSDPLRCNDVLDESEPRPRRRAYVWIIQQQRNLHFLTRTRLLLVPFDHDESRVENSFTPGFPIRRFISLGIDASRKRLREHRGPPTGSWRR